MMEGKSGEGSLSQVYLGSVSSCEDCPELAEWVYYKLEGEPLKFSNSALLLHMRLDLCNPEDDGCDNGRCESVGVGVDLVYSEE